MASGSRSGGILSCGARVRTGVCAAAACWLAALVLSGGGPGLVPSAELRAQGADASVAAHRQLFTRYCVSCHNAAMQARGTAPVALDALDVADVGDDPAAWERVVLKLRAGVMPPAGAPRPDRADHTAFVTYVEGALDRLAAANPNPGRTEPFHRLNRAEYRNAIRDLLDLEVDVSTLLPPDDASYGFDNIAGVLRMSPTLMERYLTAAQRVSRLALGSPLPAPNIDYFRITDDLSQDVHLPGMPFGTRGGTRIRYAFPRDAVYEFRVRLARDLNESVPIYTEEQHVEISVDGVRVGTFTLPGVGQPAPPARGRGAGSAGRGGGSPEGRDGPPQPEAPQISQIQQAIRVTAKERESRNTADESWNLRVPLQAGQRDVIVTFTNRVTTLEETARLPFRRPYPAGVNIPEGRRGVHLRSVEIAGPYDATGPGASQSRTRILTCMPAAPADEPRCARAILTALARRAYRRPVAAADLEPLLAFYEEGRRDGGFEGGIERALRRLLVSPEFLLRVERDPSSAKAGTPYRISDLELASRLSFFLWSSLPDDELLDLAADGRLRDRAVLLRQVQRMLADPKSAAFIDNFAGQWLYLRNLPAVVPVQSVFPDFDDTLRQAFREETRRFFESIVREDRSALDLLRADYTFLNERLAAHYGIPGVKGSHFRRVALGAGSVRGGLLGQGAILTVTSYPDRTSPVVRGKWILENLLGTPPPPPIPNVGELKPTDGRGEVLSMRERMQQHRRNPVCASCHAMMDPIGLSLENFDATGRWRTLGEAGTTIDASGALPDGRPFEGPAGLRQALLASDRFVPTIVEKLLTYSLGRGLEYYDAPAVRAIVRDSAREDYRFSSLLLGVVQSTPFQMRMRE
jgi:mono/diheme cytochrome c family protein